MECLLVMFQSIFLRLHRMWSSFFFLFIPPSLTSENMDTITFTQPHLPPHLGRGWAQDANQACGSAYIAVWLLGWVCRGRKSRQCWLLQPSDRADHQPTLLQTSRSSLLALLAITGISMAQSSCLIMDIWCHLRLRRMCLLWLSAPAAGECHSPCYNSPSTSEILQKAHCLFISDLVDVEELILSRIFCSVLSRERGIVEPIYHWHWQLRVVFALKPKILYQEPHCLLELLVKLQF